MDRSKWEAIKALQLPDPQIVTQPDVQVMFNAKGQPVGSINRAYRRGMQGRFVGVAQPRRSAARATPVDPDGRASSIRIGRAERRAARRQAFAADLPAAS